MRLNTESLSYKINNPVISTTRGFPTLSFNRLDLISSHYLLYHLIKTKVKPCG